MTATRRTFLLASTTLPLADPALGQQRTITLGYQLPLTGEFSQYGERFRNSAMMAIEAFNRSGRIPAQVTILFADTRSDPRAAVAVARSFVDNREVVAVLGDFTSSASIHAGLIHAEAGMPQLSQTASHPDFVTISPWQFRNITTPAYEGPHVARWMAANGVRRVAVVSIRNDWGQSVVSNFADAFRATGGEMVATQMFTPGNREFQGVLTDIARARPDAIHVGMFYEDGAAFLRQRRQLTIRTPVYGTSSMCEPKLIELAGPGAEGMFVSTSFMAESPEAHVRAYVQEYSHRFRSEPTMFSAQAFDAVNIMLEAIARSWPDVTRQRVRDALAKTKDFPGVTGATTFDPVTREPAKTLVRMQIRDGRFTPIRN